VELNWAPPAVVALLVLLQPVSAAAILWGIYGAAGGNFASVQFTSLYLGQALYGLVGALGVGISAAVISDRERYQTLKYLVLSPMTLPAYLAGRGTSRLVTTVADMAILLGAGIVLFHLPFRAHDLDPGLTVLAFVLGIVLFSSLGILLAGLSFGLARSGAFIGEVAASALYLISGTIYPVTALPALVQPVALLSPATWWLELMRRGILGSSVQGSAISSLPTWPTRDLLGAVGLWALGGLVLALGFFRFMAAQARKRGLLERMSNG